VLVGWCAAWLVGWLFGLPVAMERQQHALALKDEKDDAEIWRQANLIESDNYVHLESLAQKEASRADVFLANWKLEAERNKELEESRKRIESDRLHEAVQRASAEHAARCAQAALVQVLVLQDKQKSNVKVSVNPFLRKPSGFDDQRATRLMPERTRSSALQKALLAGARPTALEPFEVPGGTARHRWRQCVQ